MYISVASTNKTHEQIKRIGKIKDTTSSFSAQTNVCVMALIFSRGLLLEGRSFCLIFFIGLGRVPLDHLCGHPVGP